MLCLALEAGNPSVPLPAISGACVGTLVPGSLEHCEVLATAELVRVERQRDDLLPCIDRALRAAGVGPERIEAVAVSVGPGGFTSIRQAIAAGAMLACAATARRGQPVACIAVPSVLSAWCGWRAAAAKPAARGVCGVALASKSDSIYAAVFAGRQPQDALRAAGGARIVRAAEADEWVQGIADGELVADGHLPDGFVRAAERFEVRVVAPAQSPSSCLIAAALCPTCGPDELTAIYGREPEAVTLWRQRHGPRA